MKVAGCSVLKALFVGCLLLSGGLKHAKAATTNDTPKEISTITIRGEAQFWQRTCEPGGVCSMPTAISPRLPVLDSLSRPRRGSEVSFVTIELGDPASAQKVDDSGLRAKLQVFWHLDAGSPGGSYLAMQTRLQKVDALPLGECSQYVEEKETVFPVGFCSAYQTSDGKLMQYGISYYKFFLP
jgi:hypothetical protein